MNEKYKKKEWKTAHIYASYQHLLKKNRKKKNNKKYKAEIQSIGGI